MRTRKKKPEAAHWWMTPTGEWVDLPHAREQVHRLLFRLDGRVEWLCRHGIGHPVGHVRQWQSWMSVHGCDGCCQDPERPQ